MGQFIVIGGGSSAVQGTVVPDVATLSTLGANFSDGAEAWTSAPRAACWRLSKNYQNLNGGAGVDNIRTVQATGGVAAAWVRDVDLGMPGASDFPTWYADSVAGDDNADGLTALTPVQHVEEVLYRVGKQPLNGLIGGGMVIHVSGDFSISADSLTISPHFIFDGTMSFVGVKTVLATYTITAVTPWDDATGTPGAYTLSGAPNFTTLGYVGKFIRISVSAGVSVVGWKATIAKDLGSGTFRGVFGDQSQATAVEPAVGDTVTVYDVTKFYNQVRICPTGGIPDQGSGVNFQDLIVGGSGNDHAVTVSSGVSYFVACEVNGLDVLQGASYVNLTCSRTRDFRTYSSSESAACTHLTNGGVNIGTRAGGVYHGSARNLLESVPTFGAVLEVGNVNEGPGNVVLTAPLVVADYGTGNTDAVIVYANSSIRTSDYLYLLNGTGSGAGFRVYSSGGIYYATGKALAMYGTKPSVESSVGGTSKVMGALPFINTANSAAIVVNQ